MHRMSTSIAFVLTALFLVSISPAQQTSTPSPNIHIDGPIIGGDGTKNYVPLWLTPNYLQSSVIYQASGGNIGIGTTTPAATLDVNGGINAAKTYGIGGTSVLSIGSGVDNNLFLGVGAGEYNITGRGISNTFTGFGAGYGNLTGFNNTYTGAYAGSNTTTGSYNTFTGGAAGIYNTGSENTFTGSLTGFSNTSGGNNTFTGETAGEYNTSGGANTFTGQSAGFNNATGNSNTCSSLPISFRTMTAIPKERSTPATTLRRSLLRSTLEMNSGTR
jgi:hypothetical protein